MNSYLSLSENRHTLINQIYNTLHYKSGGFSTELDESPVETIYRIYKGIENPNIKSTIKELIIDLFNSFIYKKSELQYYRSLCVLIGLLKITELHNDLSHLAVRSEYKDIFIDETADIHQLLLSTLVSLGIRKKDCTLFERDLFEKKYCTLCFQALWEFDLMNAKKHISTLVSQFTETDNISSLVITIDILLRSASIDYIASVLLPDLFNNLDNCDNTIVLFKAVESAGFILNFFDNSYKVTDNFTNCSSQEYDDSILPKQLKIEYVRSFEINNRNKSISETIEEAFNYALITTDTC